VRLADGGVDFRTPHQAAYEKCWQRRLCQTCGGPLGCLAVLFGGPNQLAAARFDEPPLCPPCALYASKACPMVAGRQAHYADRARVSEGPRGKTCPDPGCDCGGGVPTDPDAPDHGGDPAHAWYACYVDPAELVLTARTVDTVCSDRGCRHVRTVVSGCLLTTPPIKVFLVSEPRRGRTWRRLTPEESAALLPETYGVR
jgi:hypothetical protein